MVGGAIAVSYAIALYRPMAHMNTGFGDKNWSVNRPSPNCIQTHIWVSKISVQIFLNNSSDIISCVEGEGRRRPAHYYTG